MAPPDATPGGITPMSEKGILTFSLTRKLPDAPSYYAAALASLRRFVHADSLPPERLTPELIARYRSWLRGAGKSDNTISSYLRALRAIHGADVKAGLAAPTDAFASLAAETAPRAGKKAPAAPADRSRWRALLNSAFATREELAQSDPLLSRSNVFIPRATIMKRTPSGLKPAPDPTLARLLFFRATTADATALQQRLERRATVIFHRDGTRRTLAAIPDREMHMFRLAISGGIESIGDYDADTRPFSAQQRVRVVGHPLFDGLEGTVVADADATTARVSVAITGLNKLLLTPSLPKEFLLPL